MHRANEIRPLMKRVAVLAEKYHCAIILIGHMNKTVMGNRHTVDLVLLIFKQQPEAY